MKNIFIILAFFLTLPVFSHSGRTDSSGGHNCRTGSCAGSYHYHNGGSSSKKTKSIKKAVTCGENQCKHGNSCFDLPENASCTERSSTDAWECDTGYYEDGNKCKNNQVTGIQEKKKNTFVGSSIQGNYPTHNVGQQEIREEEPKSNIEPKIIVEDNNIYTPTMGDKKLIEGISLKIDDISKKEKLEKILKKLEFLLATTEKGSKEYYLINQIISTVKKVLESQNIRTNGVLSKSLSDKAKESNTSSIALDRGTRTNGVLSKNLSDKAKESNISSIVLDNVEETKEKPFEAELKKQADQLKARRKKEKIEMEEAIKKSQEIKRNVEKQEANVKKVYTPIYKSTKTNKCEKYNRRTGPRGGCYYINSNGNKSYDSSKHCC